MRAAILLMCAGAAAELAVLITVIVTAGSVRAAVARRYPGLPAAHAVNVNLVTDYIGASIGIAVWLVLIWALIRGRDRARIALMADFGAMSLSMIIAIGQDSAAYAPADLIAGAVEWLIALAATVLLFTGTSSRYYRPEPRPVIPWRGTFGSM